MQEKQRKKEGTKKQASSEEDVTVSEGDNKSPMPVICSKSYIVPGNPLHPENADKWLKHLEEIARNGGRQKFSDIETTRSTSRLGWHTPMAVGSRSRHDAPSRLETPNDYDHPVKKPPHLLPKIESAHIPRIKSPGIKTLALHPDVEIPEGAVHVQKTHSAMSFTVCYAPPRCLPPIPRHRSDVTNGTARDKQKKHPTGVGAGGKKTEFQPDKRHHRVGSPRKIHRNGGTAMDKIRNTVEGNRQARESRNMATIQSKLEQRDKRATRIAQTADVTSRVNDVKAEQN